jgi:bifunctional non-homologous end joining protein LigD
MGLEGALRLRRMLKDEGLEPWPKLTGGKGLHLMAPLEPKIDHDHARAYAKRIAQRLAATASDRYTIAAAPEKRVGRIFIDYLRNGRGTTAIGAWSPRARAGSPIAVPVSWRQVEDGIRPDAFTMDKPPPRQWPCFCLIALAGSHGLCPGGARRWAAAPLSPEEAHE